MPSVVVEPRALRTASHHHRHNSSSTSEGFGLDQGGLLLKQVTPRNRQDQFGRDNTRHADFLLSMAVFPTGVRTPLLSELQQKTEHQCGFEVTETGNERQGRQVNIRDSKPNSSRRDSATDSAKKPPPNTPLTVSVKLTDRTHRSQSVTTAQMSMSHKERYRWVNASTPGTRSNSAGLGNSLAKGKDIRDPLYLNTYCPGERKLRYNKSSLPMISARTRPWTVSEPNPSYRFARNSQDVASGKMNDRRVKTTLPKAPRVGNFRIDARDVNTRAKGRSSAHVSHGMEDADAEDDDDERSTTGSQALLEVKSYFPQTGNAVLADQRDTLKGKEGCLHTRVKQCIRFVKYREKLARSVERPLKQEGGRYRPISTTSVKTPQISPPGSPTPHQRHPDPTSVEIYKEYIDAIALQTRLVSAADKRRKPRPAASSVPRYNTAASSYHDGASSSTSAALQSVSDCNRAAHSGITSATTTLEKTPRITMASNNNGNSSVRSSTGVTIGGFRRRLSSTHPAVTVTGSSSSATAAGTSAGAAAAATTKEDQTDPLGVHQALDIIRLSPKALPPRSSRTTARSSNNKSLREILLEGDGESGEGGGEGEWGGGESTTTKSHAIVLPHVSKSATTSVCSFPDEPTTAPET